MSLLSGLRCSSATAFALSHLLYSMTNNAVNALGALAWQPLAPVETGGGFGQQVLLSGQDTLVVTDHLEGAAHYFRRDDNTIAIGGDEWIWQGKLTDGTGSFGSVAAVGGDTMVVGPCGEGPTAVCIFERPAGTHDWSLDSTVSIGTSLHSASVSDDGTMIGIGLVGSLTRVEFYTKTEEGGTWEPMQTLDEAVPSFGWNMDCHGDYMIVGAPFAPELGTSQVGRARVYRRSQAAPFHWQQEGVDLVPRAARAASDRLGWSVSIAPTATGNMIAVVGAPNSPTGITHGFVSVFKQQGGTTAWTEIATLTSGFEGRDRFGHAVATDGVRILVACYDTNEVFSYIFDDSNDEVAYDNRVSYDVSPNSVAIMGEDAVVGIPPTIGGEAIAYRLQPVSSDLPTAGGDGGRITELSFETSTDVLTIAQEDGTTFNTFIDVQDGDSDPTNELISGVLFDRDTSVLTISEGGTDHTVTLNMDVIDGDADPTNELITSMHYDPVSEELIIVEGCCHTVRASIPLGSGARRRRTRAENENETKPIIPRLVLSATVPVLKEATRNGEVPVHYGEAAGASNGFGMILPGRIFGFGITLEEPFTSKSTTIEVFVTVNGDIVLGNNANVKLVPGDVAQSAEFPEPINVDAEDIVRFRVVIDGEKVKPKKLGARLALLLEQ